ncbi:protein phosphatase 2C [Histomonas meleagridis]|uniref:protein phosphatase 2C n=1 Tax=Histomonas meleagridis TaxID=135588 RepID=UPI00355A3923|nr:protein phosphatase 2C [Histomonas meleagridis]KAH0799895.1 protein phosphatase 2C [Histomonas meleagridis]
MGGGGSSLKPEGIPNAEARSFFIATIPTQKQIPEKLKRYNKTFNKVMYDSLKKNPEKDNNFSLTITGKGTGPIFIDFYFPVLHIPQTLTKLSLRKCSLQQQHCKSISRLLISLPNLQQFDAGDNDFGDSIQLIFNSVAGHPSLTALILDNCHIPENVTQSIIDLINTSRKIDTLRITTTKSTSNQKRLSTALMNNLYLKNTTISDDLTSLSATTNERNIAVSNIVDSIVRSPFQRRFRSKIESFKSIKGREMLIGRAGQKERIRGTALFDDLEAADKRAKTIESQETHQNTELFRSGQADMIGRRQTMEDVSIILMDMPRKGAALYGLFDGHGGREAAEFAAANLPKAISERLKATANVEDAYVASFRQLQMDMKPWCVYVGTTSVIAVVEGTTLTVANVGDTRCVLCRDGKAERLTVDHKPDLPDEAAYIQSKGGFVKEGRLGGMLAVSRALGDSFLGDAVNATPSFRTLELNENDSFLILACDGVWDVMSDQEACDIVAAEIDPLNAAKKLRDAAFELNSLDNISVIVVFLAEAFAHKENNNGDDE